MIIAKTTQSNQATIIIIYILQTFASVWRFSFFLFSIHYSRHCFSGTFHLSLSCTRQSKYNAPHLRRTQRRAPVQRLHSIIVFVFFFYFRILYQRKFCFVIFRPGTAVQAIHTGRCIYYFITRPPIPSDIDYTTFISRCRITV